MKRSAHRVAIVALSLVLGGVYLSTLLPGVGAGDIAEIQAMSPLLGVCHVPGYAIEVTAGKLFSLLPLGGDIARRLNLMMALCGLLGCLALYGAVRRVTQSVLAGIVAASLLGFSSTYWSFAIVAEAYVFHGMFLLIAVYTTVRLSESGKPLWLYLTALSLGICIGGRSSEALTLIGFAAALSCLRKRISFDRRTVAASVALFLLPFAYAVGYHLVRYDPVHPHARDYTFAERVKQGRGDSLEDDRSGPERILDSVKYSLGYSWAEKAVEQTSLKRIKEGIPRYSRLLSGMAIVEGDAPPGNLAEQERGFGTSIGMTGLLLALAGAIFFRRRGAWVSLGLGLFVGNLVFYLWHFRWDGLTFTVPGLAGIALLAGLGAVGPDGWRIGRWWSAVGITIGMATAIVLLVANYPLVDRSESHEPLWAPHLPVESARHFPQDSILILSYWQSTTYRYLLHVEAGRTDILIGIHGSKDLQEFLIKVRELDRPTFIRGPKIPRSGTPPELARFGFLMIHPGSRRNR